MRECVDAAATRHAAVIDGRRVEPRVTTTVERQYPAMDVPADAPIFRRAREAAARCGQSLAAASSCGSSDANVLNARGIACVDLGNGMRRIHTLGEWIDLRDLWRAIELAVEIVRSRPDEG
jgi:tripeptide aminopeptidase